MQAPDLTRVILSFINFKFKDFHNSYTEPNFCNKHISKKSQHYSLNLNNTLLYTFSPKLNIVTFFPNEMHNMKNEHKLTDQIQRNNYYLFVCIYKQTYTVLK